MADNVVLNAGSGGDTIAADDDGTAKHQYVKVEFGANDTQTPVSAANPLPIEGGEAHDAPATDVPILVAGRADTTAPTAVIDGDVCYLFVTTEGAVVMAGHDGTNPQKISTDAAGQLQVDVLTLPALPAGTNNIGDVDVLTLPALPAGTNNIGDVDVLTLPALPAGTNNIGDVDIASALPAGTNNIGDVDIASALPAGSNVIGNVGLEAGTNNIGDVDIASFPAAALEVVGDVAHDAAAGGNPVLVAARANTDEPATAVAAGDSTYLWADTFGRLVTLPGHPNPVAPVYINATASGDTAVIAAPGAGVSLYIVRVAITNGAASVINVQLQENGTATNRGPGDLAADGGGIVMDFGPRGWKLTANTGLDINLGATGDVHVTVLEHYIAA